MVGFFLSCHRDDDSFVARLIDDALTARFGSASVFHPEAEAEADAGRLRRLAKSTAMIAVIGSRWRASVDGPAGDPSDAVGQEVETAFALDVPVVGVLVDDAEQPTEADLPPALRPLGDARFWRVRLPSAYSDNRRLVDDLATILVTDTAAAGRSVPVLLDDAPVRLAMPPPAPGAAVVYSTRTGDLEVAEAATPRLWSPGDVARYSTRYEVDTDEHRVVLHVPLPSRDFGRHFRASIAAVFRVTDPAQVVRRAVSDAVPPVRAFLLDTCRPITRQFGVSEIGDAAAAVRELLDSDLLAPGGITLRSARTRLEPGTGDTDRGARWERASVGAFSRRVHRYRGPGAGRRPSTGAWSRPGSGVGVRPQPTRLLVARAPSQVPVGQDLSVDVRLVTKGRRVGPGAVTAQLTNLVVADAGTPVTVTVHAPAGLHAEGPLQQTVLVRPGEDPAPVRFGFGARTPGLHRVDVTAWAGGTFLAEVSVEVSVATGGPFRDGLPRRASLPAPRARPGEVTMEVRFDGTRYTFQLRSDAGALFAPVVESVTNTPNAAVENAIRELQQLARGGSRYSAAMTRQLIRSAGIQLWSELVPGEIQDQFWQVGGTMSAFTIATDYDVVPWELLYPLSAERDAGFLVEQVPVVRRTYGQHATSKIGLGNPRFVVPAKAPTGAHEEVAAIRAILGAADGDPITRADELLDLINSGSLGATHFACHNTFSADGSFIDLDGGPFRPALLAEASIRKPLRGAVPLVFINACRSAGVAPTYTRMLGWAQQFMASGAGAFVGTLWAVRSESSARFATAFYQSLAEGATLGAAALAARTEQQDDPLDPTWLAYAVYGDPFATAA
ncbi:CHAT domain-containing protein [Micromonospora sp. NPDC047527]|uniref:CHAT domain-containing protein n=1 Tax=Micromonospora sp. NPDC047527 TaxID=3155144 RepID=UPI0033C1A7C6